MVLLKFSVFAFLYIGIRNPMRKTISVHLAVACDIYDGVFLCCPFSRDVLDEILNLIESVPEGFSTYSSIIAGQIEKTGNAHELIQSDPKSRPQNKWERNTHPNIQKFMKGNLKLSLYV